MLFRIAVKMLFVLALFNIHLWGYIPEVINGKYEFYTIDSSFYYSNWMQTTMRNDYGSETLVREAFAPSAMVDKDGVLFAVTLYGFSGSDGPCFKISKHTPSGGGSISYTNTIIYPWSSKYTGISPNTSSEPHFGAYNGEEKYFRDCIYNVFSPCIAQELGDGSTGGICLFFYIPPTRFMNKENSDTEGLMYLGFDKSSLAFSAKGFYKNSSNKVYRFDRQRPCRVSTSHKFYPQISSYSAWHVSSDVHVIWIGLTEYYDKQSPNNFSAAFYSQYNNSWASCNSVSQVNSLGTATPGGMAINDRYVLFDDDVYGMVVIDGCGPRLIMQMYSNNKVTYKAENWNFLYMETFSRGESQHTVYNYDFCILRAKDGIRIWCILGFNASGSYSPLDETCNWSSTYCNWNTSCLSLTFRSFALNSITPFNYSRVDTWNNYVQNVIYTTDIVRGSGTAVSSEDTKKSDLYRLYLNTHKMCVWTSPKTGCQYIIYAYCYPGLKKQLYLGYAPIEIDANHKVHLLTKTEFKDSSGNSFGDFTSCSRIISMDCRNDHLWVTFMNEDNSIYKYFHIKASDLIQE